MLLEDIKCSSNSYLVLLQYSVIYTAQYSRFAVGILVTYLLLQYSISNKYTFLFNTLLLFL